ncbi:MAG: hypothetical protein A2729_02100 [Candidatus Buchananbacteria bacterium RIFCSPHIGHO2_01_FULL_39_14]|uniref:Uncharacterized protein n=1 Tax=Candidatus Buchananbacteria bacterium RIFCSPHIGHO2_01_FULL_39_14 TaxID=1797532 RepID=A0A1G1XWE4_9BACT|nr:MAG: hypothetical protein A2729_02100 [Candidatus Buchananbacteria bacterium RIFCSPHIGHO2_01_FULL_39_14]OGY48200.1 MAG: hypothetical protein A3D39_03700 [Candidatus Buchananbacteria bacterium RIFCSPHIGHO2_02_FULL_39_17]
MLRQRQQEREQKIIIIALIITLLISSFLSWFINEWWQIGKLGHEKLRQLPPPSTAEKQLTYKYLSGMRGPDSFYRELTACKGKREK